MCDLLNRSCFERGNNTKKGNINNRLIKLNSARDLYPLVRDTTKWRMASTLLSVLYVLTLLGSFQAHTQLSWNFSFEFQKNCFWLTLFVSVSLPICLPAAVSCTAIYDELSWWFVFFLLWTSFDFKWVWIKVALGWTEKEILFWLRAVHKWRHVKELIFSKCQTMLG